MAYQAIDPFGETRADLRSAIVATTVANVAGAKTEVKDFMPNFGDQRQPRKRMSAEQIYATLVGYAENHNATLR